MSRKSFVRASVVSLIALAIGVVAGAATADGPPEVFYACEKDGNIRSGSVSVGTQPACSGDSRLVSWNEKGPVGEQGPPGPQGPQGPAGPPAEGASFVVREHVYSVPVGPSYDWVEFSASCNADEAVIGGGLYWNDIEMPTISGERTPAGDTGHPEDNAWVTVMLQVTPEELEFVTYGDFTVFAVCAS